jgi:pyruvate dehydrogenase E1 component beta subunit
LLLSAIRDDDPVAVFIPVRGLDMREDVSYADLAPQPLGVGRVHREGSDVTVVAIGHLVREALAVAEQLADEISIEVFDPRTLFPFDWASLAASLEKTGRLVVFDDTNRFAGVAAEIVAVAAEEMRLVAVPRRITRADGAILGLGDELDRALEPGREQLLSVIQAVMKSAR